MLKRFLLITLMSYLILIGATFNGVVQVQTRLLGGALIACLCLIWAWSQRRWRWHPTALDSAILLWGIAFAISLVANSEVARRSAIGLWFVGLYIAIYYALHHALSNKGLQRQWLVDGMLIAGVPIVFVGFAQVQMTLNAGLPIPRPVSTFGNPNTFAAFLVMLLPFLLTSLAAAKKPLPRTVLGVYAVAALGLGILTFSRGGWIGGAVALGVWAGLSLPLRRWWGLLSTILKSMVLIIGVGAIIGFAGILLYSLTLGGRTLDLRTWLYDTAVQLFAERPLTGTGFYTFGAGLARLNALPPLEPHSHAHNIILHVAAELGLIGLLPLALTGAIILRALWVGFRKRTQDRFLIIGLSAFVGFIVHQLLDVPVMMPTIALVAVVVLVLALPAREEALPQRHWHWQPVGLAFIGLILTLSGGWEALNYRDYVAALSSGIASSDYRAAADRLQVLIDRDPRLAIYSEQQGMLLGLAAASGDQGAARQAVASFVRYTTLEPSYVSGWANLAAMQAQTGDFAGAILSIERALVLSPDMWSLLYRLGEYREAVGDPDGARRAYDRTLRLNPTLMFSPEWNESPVRVTMTTGDYEVGAYPQTIFLLAQADVAAARVVWQAFPGHTISDSTFYVIHMIFALADGDPATANSLWDAARRTALNASHRGWLALGQAFRGEIALDQAMSAARAQVTPPPTGSDWALGLNKAYSQFLHLAIPRQFLPQVGYSEVDGMLLYLLRNEESLRRLMGAATP